jgi:hypothetical protein
VAVRLDRLIDSVRARIGRTAGPPLVKLPAMPIRVATSRSIALPLMVSSHERSGTHFLMNSVAANSDHCAKPYLNFDWRPLGASILFSSSRQIRDFFAGLQEMHCASIVKNHFAADYFVGEQGDYVLGELCRTVYIVRDPVEVMLSYDRYIRAMPFYEGPKVPDVATFMAAAPRGAMLRYQSVQAATVLERWVNHVRGWTRMVAGNANALTITYHDLDRSHAATMQRVLAFLGLPCPPTIVRPDPIANTIHVPIDRHVSTAYKEALRAQVIAMAYGGVLAAVLPDLYGSLDQLAASNGSSSLRMPASAAAGVVLPTTTSRR